MSMFITSPVKKQSPCYYSDIFEKLIKKNIERKIKVICIGDSVLDIYKHGDMQKISQEFPIPILYSLNKNEFLFAGGCSNVANQFSLFESEVFLITFLDNKLKEVILNCRIKSGYSVNLNHGFVPQKIRYYSNNYPVFRHDIESPFYGEKSLEVLKKLAMKNFDKVVLKQNIDVVILSDYNKGFWDYDLAQHVIKRCKELNIITIVDPKLAPLDKWEYCNIFKLNSKEAFSLTGGKTCPMEQVDILQKKIGCDAIIVTNSGFGFYGKSNEYFEYKQENLSKEVNSTIGAGDFYNSALALFLSHNIGLFDACVMAFKGGLEYVKKRYNEPIGLYEIYKQFDSIRCKIIDIDKLIKFKDKGEEKFTFSNGCFDGGLTLGHIECLKYAKSLGHKLVVGINSDNSVKRLKGKTRPIFKLDERMKIVAALECVDFVVSFEEDTPLEVIKKIKPEFVVKGGDDYRAEDVVGFGLAEVVICPTYNCLSTTDKIKVILNENLGNMKG